MAQGALVAGAGILGVVGIVDTANAHAPGMDGEADLDRVAEARERGNVLSILALIAVTGAAVIGVVDHGPTTHVIE
jgi:hypothetical protein